MRLRPPYLLHLLAIVVGVVTLSANAVSQRYLVHTYGELDGLPSGRIADIAQDAAGRIWFATRQHLASYDGYEWSTPLFAAGMGPQTMERVLVDDLDRVWALPAKAKNRVICRIDGSWRQLPLLPDLDMASGQLPWTAATTWTGPQGTELLGTIGGVHSYRCAGASWQPLVWPAELRDATITDIEQAGSALFVATTSGLYRVDAEFRTASLVPGTGESRILGLGRDPTNETVWVLADPWLGRVSGSELHIAVEDLGISGQAASYYEGPIVDRLGGVLVGAMRHVLRYDPRGSVEPITRANGLAKEGATGLLCDREGNVWVGSVGWASKLVDLRFATADAEHGLLETEVTALVQRADGTYAVGHPTGITLVPDLQAFGSRQQHRLQHIQLDVPLDPAHRLLDLEERADGTLWFAYQGRGLGSIDADHQVRWHRYDSKAPERTTSLLWDDQDHLWVSETYSLYRREGAELIDVPLELPGISVVYVRKLFQGREGRVYAGTTNGVIVFDGDQVQNWANPEDPGANNVFAMLDSPAGAIWVGTTAGLQRVTDGRLATPQPAALWMQRPTYFLVEDELGQLWCGTDDGVVCWDPASSPETARRFTVQDGLAGRETNRDAGLLATNGDVWLGTERGLSVHRRRYAAPRRPAPVLRLLPTEVSGKAHDPALPLEVRSTNHTLTFRFRATYLADEARLQYRYRLFGNDLDWTGPAANSSQTVRYTNLKAGTYRFEIQARGPDTPWSPVIETADISVPTVFWVRPWFILLSILVLTGLTYGALRSLADRRSMKDLERQVAERLGEIRTLEAGIERSRQLQSLGVLAGGIAHDFNNLLTVMTGSFSLLTENHDVPEEQQAICQDGLAATARAKALTQQLLTFSRGGAPLLRPGSIGDIINESARFIMRGSDIRCVIDLPDDLWQVEMDPDQISQVISNLLLNAKQASAKGSTITIRGRNRETVNHGRIEPRSVEIEICDQGRGIPQDRIPSIFDPYFSTKEGGSGLGLATSYSIVKRHGGQLMAQSTEGHGTTMRFFIPATSAQVTDAATRPAREPANESFRVLVMDDEAQVRTVLGRMLEHLGHQPTFARDGEEALEVYAQALGEGRPIEVVLMDLTVPGGMGGQETIARLRHLDPRARAIVVSGYSNDPVLANHQDHGFCARLAKPVSIKDLAQALSRAADTPEVARPVP